MRNKLISSLAGVAFSVAASGLAIAADIATKAPAPSPAPVYNWTGWYVGVNAGASFGNVKTDFNAPVNLFVSQFIFAQTFTGTGTFGVAGSNREYPDGFMGGGQIGYNWQYSPLIVLGLEADFQGALEKDSNTLTNNFTGFATNPKGFATLVEGSTVLNYQTKIEWFGTARVRVGYVWGNGTVMSYLTGGLAYGKVDLEGTSTSSGTVGCCPPFSLTQAIGHSQVNTGWVVGYGTEGALAIPGWTWKVEGLWMDLGTLDATGPGASSTITIPGPATTTATGQVTTHSHFTDGILRGGLNYRFY